MSSNFFFCAGVIAPFSVSDTGIRYFDSNFRFESNGATVSPKSDCFKTFVAGPKSSNLRLSLTLINPDTVP